MAFVRDAVLVLVQADFRGDVATIREAVGVAVLAAWVGRVAVGDVAFVGDPVLVAVQAEIPQ